MTFMRKRVVSEYIDDELRKGKNIEQIRKRLLVVGYNTNDVDDVLRDFKYREARINDEEGKLKRNLVISGAILLIIILVNATIFLYQSSNPNYVLVKETPTGLITEPITKEELQNLEESFNLTGDSSSG